MRDRDAGRPVSPDDGELGDLIRDVAGGWVMPPQRLGQRTWRDRVRLASEATGGRNPLAGGRRARVAAAATTAVAATIVLALAATWLTGPRGQTTGHGSPTTSGTASAGPPSASAGPSAGASAGPSPSPLPTFELLGGPLPVARILVGGDDRRVVDLTDGSTAVLAGATSYRDRFFAADDGWRCLCLTLDAPEGQETSVRIDLVTYDRSGAERSRVAVETIAGGVADATVVRYGAPVAVAISAAPTPDRAFIGWTVRTPTAWRSGVDLIALVSGQRLSRITLPDAPTTATSGGTGPRPAVVLDPPLVQAASTGGGLLIGQLRGSAGPVDLVWDRSVHWSVTLDAPDQPVPLATGAGTLDAGDCSFPDWIGFVAPGGFGAACPDRGVLRRVDPEGRPLGDVPIPGYAADGAFGAWVSGPGGIGYLGLPFDRTVVAVDLAAGQVLGTVRLSGPSAEGPGSPIDALAGLARRLGSWIAPPAAAKIWLDPAMAISPDGARLYVLGTTATSLADSGTGAGSTGIHVIDTASLREVATWTATADWMSIATSADGSLVYAAGLPGAPAAGAGERPDAGIEASLTVLDASDGAVRAIAGQLGSGVITLDPALVP